MTLSMQWLTMGMMLLSGIGMGVVFDGYRVVSNELRFPKWWLPVLDMVYWLASALIIFRVLYASNNGEVRAYVFLGLVIGVASYYWLFSKAVIAIVKWLIIAIRACVRFLLKCIDMLIIKPVLLLYKLVRVIIGFGSALTIFLLKVVIQLIRPFWLLLAFVTRPLVKPLVRRLGPYVERMQLAERGRHLLKTAIKGWTGLKRWFTFNRKQP
ncbi:spore cortex biosynthesis protein YabQ [Paenibacillus sp. NPDC058071]|uniref:spore cortex biosynthesis protein YabQ n=1 Tax=Paenibacillus sp. NPDC058071 TaxID=3346326 RepID=UPI0036DC344A